MTMVNDMEKDVTNFLNFNLGEVKEYTSDIECIKYLLKECKNRKMDSNLYYELLYFHTKFKHWLEEGIEDNLIRITVEDLMNNLQIILNSVSEDDSRYLYYNHNESVSLKEYDKIRYKETDNINANLGYVRQLYTDEVYDRMSKISNLLTYALLFIPLSGVFIFLVSTCASCFLPLLFSDAIIVIMKAILAGIGVFEILMFIYILFLYFNNLIAKVDSLESYRTGIYKLQKPKDYKYFYTEENSSFYLYDRIWRNEILSYYNNNYKYIYNLLSDYKNGITYKERFQILVDLELDYVANFERMKESGLLKSNMIDDEMKDEIVTAEIVEKRVEEYLKYLGNVIN